ncbi:MAG: right-handed parallel beta-helix repeat-containing protein, partial [Candidatus Heimdallarchaeaceae archaeon]
GIYLQSTNTAIITYNQILDNGNYGIYLDSNSMSNVIHHNNFTDNNPGSSQAGDDGTGNVFYDIVSLEGNWWIGDWYGGSYAIAGTAGTVDPYPLGTPMIPEFTNNVTMLLLLSITSLTVVYIIGANKRKLRK